MIMNCTLRSLAAVVWRYVEFKKDVQLWFIVLQLIKSTIYLWMWMARSLKRILKPFALFCHFLSLRVDPLHLDLIFSSSGVIHYSNPRGTLGIWYEMIKRCRNWTTGHRHSGLWTRRFTLVSSRWDPLTKYSKYSLQNNHLHRFWKYVVQIERTTSGSKCVTEPNIKRNWGESEQQLQWSDSGALILIAVYCARTFHHTATFSGAREML